MSQIYFIGVIFHVFWTVFPSIIRSSRLYILQQAYVKLILLSACQRERDGTSAISRQYLFDIHL